MDEFRICPVCNYKRGFHSSFKKEGNIEIEEATKFDSSFDDLWKKVSGSFPIITKRDCTTLNWRFVNQPYWDYKIFRAKHKEGNETRGYVVLRYGLIRGVPTGVVSDFLAHPDDTEVIKYLLAYILMFFESEKKADIIRFDIQHTKIEKQIFPNKNEIPSVTFQVRLKRLKYLLLRGLPSFQYVKFA